MIQDVKPMPFSFYFSPYETTSLFIPKCQRERFAHQLGNLTLSGYKFKLGTMEFLKKRDRKNDQGDFIGYCNGLYLNADLASREDWNEAAITERTDKMLKDVMSILSVRGDK